MSERTCVVCRKTCPKERLLRFVVSGEVITLDLAQRLEGRGAYAHPDTGCLYHKRLWQLLCASMNRVSSKNRKKAVRSKEGGQAEEEWFVAPAADLLEVLRRGLVGAVKSGDGMHGCVEDIVKALERTAGSEGRAPSQRARAKFRL